VFNSMHYIQNVDIMIYDYMLFILFAIYSIWKQGQSSYENSEKTMYLKDISCKCKVLINIQGERNHKKMTTKHIQKIKALVKTFDSLKFDCTILFVFHRGSTHQWYSLGNIECCASKSIYLTIELIIKKSQACNIKIWDITLDWYFLQRE
jgi:hypothetical protein